MLQKSLSHMNDAVANKAAAEVILDKGNRQ